MAAVLLLAAGAGQLDAAGKKLSPLSDSLRKVRKTPSFTAREAFRKFSVRQGKGWKVRYNPRTALPEALTGGRTARYPGTPEQAALAFFSDNAELLKVDPLSLRLAARQEFMGVTHLQYQQYKDGLPVEFSYARVHVAADGSVSGYQGKFEPELDLNAAPAVSGEAAVMAAAADLGRQLRVSKIELVIFPDEESGLRKLAWKIRGRGNGLWVYYIDAADGSVIFKYDDLRRAYTDYNTYGVSSGQIYPISPIPTNPASGSMAEASWEAVTTTPLQDQYVWVHSYSSVTVTNLNGQYAATQTGKVFSSLKGPYFSVTNFRGESAHWDNATGALWENKTTLVQSPHPYGNSQTYNYPVAITNDWTGRGYNFAKALPHFTAFQAGELDIYGSMNDGDQMYIKSGALDGANTVGAYTGNRGAFYGASVESPSYTISLKTDEAGTYNGFTADVTKVLLLPDGDHASANGAAGSVVWGIGQSSGALDTSVGSANALSEVNAFYHLNKVRRYFDAINIDPSRANAPAADLTKRVAVMAHAHGNADAIGAEGGMLNAYYDLENDNILLGDGPMAAGSYRSFALDGTIVRHEYIHLVINRIYPIINFGEFGAISEGLADYFSMASFWNEPCTGCSSISTLGNFIGSGEGSARNIDLDTANCGPDGSCVMPEDWVGEVHDDGMMMSQTLYALKKTGGLRDIGTFASGSFSGQRRADVLAFAALFYFPDNFANYYEAMLAACKQFNATWANSCDATVQGKIFNAFADHGIGSPAAGDLYEYLGDSAMCDSNNGPECAAEIEDLSSLSATVSPLGDVDYYSVPLAAGNFTATLSLPAAGETTYTAYSLFLFDANRNYIAEATPVASNTEEGYCPDAGDCVTQSPSVGFSYTVPRAGRYYLVVSGAPNQWYGNSEANSLTPYTLTLARSPAGSATARIAAAIFDGDEIAFDVPYSAFPMVSAPSSSTLSGAELVFEYARLRDHNYSPIDNTRTNVAGSYLNDIPSARAYTVDAFGTPVVSGKVKLQPGFAARYPGVGTIYLELFGRNHMGQVVALGVSNPLNLSGGAAEAVAYNNIITGTGDAAIIKYSVTGAGNLTVKVYTQSGSLVKTVYSGPVTAGKGTVDWDGKNSSGGKAASGIYFVKTKGPGLDKVVKIAVVR